MYIGEKIMPLLTVFFNKWVQKMVIWVKRLKNFPEQKQFQGLKRGNPLFLDEEKYQVKTADRELFFFLFWCFTIIFCRRSTRSGWRMRFQWRLRGCTIRTCSFSSTGTNSRYIFEPFEPSWGSILNNHLSYILLVPANSFDSFFGTIRDWTHIGSSSTSCLFKLIEPNNK